MGVLTIDLNIWWCSCLELAMHMTKKSTVLPKDITNSPMVIPVDRTLYYYLHMTNKS